ncbi:NYN domain-containing protein [Candidatus Woesearchaeota archaeon]|nr:NYN domain-containing protein [Candidatus Woesearchaeota archaeon]
MLQQPKGQRVGVFVDVQNLYYSARFRYDARVNFKSILSDAVKNRVLIRAIAYVIRTEEVKKEIFFEALSNIGFEIKAKDLQIFYGGAKKGDWDVGIAMDTIELAPKLDTVVLISGDGDFVPLVEHLKRAMGCRVEVMAFGKSSSSKLIEAADSFTDLDQNLNKFLMKRITRTKVKDDNNG